MAQDLLNRIMQMQQQGVQDTEIVATLQREGITPKEINDALGQAQVKSAVSPEDSNTQQGMQPSIMQNDQGQVPQPPAPEQGQQVTQEVAQAPAQAPEMYPAEGQVPAPEGQVDQNYYADAPQAYTGQEQYYAPQAPMDSEVITEIAEQVTSEKINELRKKVSDVSGFKTEITEKVADISDRLKRIEASLDKINHAVLQKVGEFGESSAMIHKDLENVHDTMSKMMNPLMDNYNELKKIADKE